MIKCHFLFQSLEPGFACCKRVLLIDQFCLVVLPKIDSVTHLVLMKLFVMSGLLMSLR